MKAMVVQSPGAPFELVEVSRPEPRVGEALVRIHASGVNPLDIMIRARKAAHARQPLPAILGIDLAGTVEAVSPGVTSLQPGDEVFGMTGGVGGIPGSLAEFAAVDARLLARKPANVSMREAAALPLIFITAWEGLVDRVALRAGQNLLVLGGGGVATMAIQLARGLGATVYCAVSPSKTDTLRGYGAVPVDLAATTLDEVIAVRTDGQGFDVVYDTLGGSSLDIAFNAVKRFGHVVSCLGWGTHALSTLSFKAASYSGVFTLLPLLTGEGREHHGQILHAAAHLVETGKLRALLDSRTFTLQTVAEAHELTGQRKAQGKLVVEIG